MIWNACMIVVDVKELETNIDKYIEIAKIETIRVLKDDKPIFVIVPNVAKPVKQ